MGTKCLLVGINAYPDSPLRGCVNDIAQLSACFAGGFRIPMESIRLLQDERATREAILERLAWLAAGAGEGDCLLFHFSGHGTIYSERGADGKIISTDQAICPADFSWSPDKMITPANIVAALNLPRGARLVWICDACHSGGAQAPALLKDGVNRTKEVPLDMQWRNDTPATAAVVPGEFASMLPGRMVMLSACGKSQVAEDAPFESGYAGALSHFLARDLGSSEGRTAPLNLLWTHTIQSLDMAGFSQRPSLIADAAFLNRPLLP